VATADARAAARRATQLSPWSPDARMRSYGLAIGSDAFPAQVNLAALWCPAVGDTWRMISFFESRWRPSTRCGGCWEE
jgi:hypothetical protein